MGDAAALMQVASGGLGYVGELISGVGDYFASKRKAEAYKNAAIQAEMEAGVEAQQAIGQGDRVAATAATRVAANGGGFVGSSIGVIDDLSAQAYFNARAAVYKGRTIAQNDLYQAKLAKRAGILSLVGAFAGGGASLLGSFAKAAQGQQQMAALRAINGQDASGGAGAAWSDGSAPAGATAADMVGLY